MNPAMPMLRTALLAVVALVSALPAQADDVADFYKGKRITLRVTATNDGITGTAMATTQKIAKKPKVKISVNGSKASVVVKDKKVKAKKFKGKVVVQKIVREDEFGAPVYKKVGTAKLRNGKATVTLKKLIKGKNKLVFEVDLKGGKYGDATVAKTVKVKKKR